MRNSLRVLQLTDPHLMAEPNQRLLGVDTAATFEQVLLHARANHPLFDVLLVTGDIAESGAKGSYLRAYQMLQSLALPQIWLPGNHDHRAAMAEVVDLPLMPVFSSGDWALVSVDSQMPGAVGGYISAQELALLEQNLARLTQPHVLVAVHHMPVPVGCAWLDRQRIANAPALAEVLCRSNKVRAVVCGHVHQAFAGELAGIPVYSSPSTWAQFKPQSDQFALDTTAPGYRVLELHPDGRCETQVYRAEHVQLTLDHQAGGY